MFVQSNFQTAGMHIAVGVWKFHQDGTRRPTVMIGGGSQAGKSFLAATLTSGFREMGLQVMNLTMDDYYFTKEEISERTSRNEGEVNFDEPEAVDLALLASDVRTLVSGGPIPKRSQMYQGSGQGFPSAKRAEEGLIEPGGECSLIIVRGLFVLLPPLSELADLRVYVEQPNVERRLERRIARDVTTRSYSREVAEARWTRSVQPGYDKYVNLRNRPDVHVDLWVNNNY